MTDISLHTHLGIEQGLSADVAGDASANLGVLGLTSGVVALGLIVATGPVGAVVGGILGVFGIAEWGLSTHMGNVAEFETSAQIVEDALNSSDESLVDSDSVSDALEVLENSGRLSDAQKSKLRELINDKRDGQLDIPNQTNFDPTQVTDDSSGVSSGGFFDAISDFVNDVVQAISDVVNRAVEAIVGLFSPVIIDLDSDGIEFNITQVVSFDVDDDGFYEQTAWAAADDGLLVIDLDADGNIGVGDGVIDQAREIAFGLWGPDGATDLQALAEATDANGNLIFDSNSDGILNGYDTLWSSFNVWRDVNQNGVTDDGELLDLVGLGITSINLAYDDQSGYADTDDDITVFENTLHGLASFIRDGEVISGGVGDVSLAYNSEGFRRVETALGYNIEFEAGFTLRYADLDSTGDQDINLVTEWLDGVSGNALANVIDASGHSLSVQVSGGDGDDTLLGGELDDMLSGDAGADVIHGGNGNDIVFFDADDVSLNGGDGIDQAIAIGDTAVTLDLAATSFEAATGTEGNDTLTAVGGSYSVNISGAAGDDTITGTDNADTLSGGDGDDAIAGAAGGDTILGGDGDDTLSGDQGDDNLFGGAGDDIITAGSGDDDVYGGAGADNIDGGSGDNTLTGGEGNDTILAGDGDDRITGGDGDDTITSLAGDDRIWGDDGDDAFYVGSTEAYTQVFGGTGADTLFLDGLEADWSITLKGLNHYQVSNGSAIFDVVNVETLVFSQDSANHALSSGPELNNEDVFISSMGHGITQLQLNHWATYQFVNQGETSGVDLWISSYTYTTENSNQFGDTNVSHHTGHLLQGSDIINGLSGDDFISTGSGNDQVNGGSGSDRINGEAGADWIEGNSGADIITGGSQNDTIYGGSGDDFITGDENNDTLFGDDGSDRVFGGVGNDILDGGDGDDLLSGEDGDDQLTGGYGNDLLYGGVGVDVLTGDQGDDLLSGNDGDDILSGDGGIDRLFGGSGNDVLNGGTGFDSLEGGEGDDILNGDADDDYLDGGEGQDTLNGGTGNDVLLGGLGADQLDGGDGIDAVSYVDLANSVTVDLAASSGTDDIAGDVDSLVSIENVFGSAFDDVIAGDGGNNLLLGGDGNDDLDGSLGNDVLDGGAGDDIVEGGVGIDRLIGRAGSDVLSGGADDDQLFGGLGDDELNGGSGDDRLDGDEGNDVLSGGAGNDQVSGGSGDDILISGGSNGSWDYLNGDDGNDTYIIDALSGSTLIGWQEGAANGSNDRVVLQGINLADVTFSTFDYTQGGTVSSNDGVALNIDWSIGGEAGLLRISNLGHHIETIEFANGETFQSVNISSGGAYLISEAGNTAIGDSSNNTLIAEDAKEETEMYGHGGDDTITGGAVDDVIYGGSGDDIIHGGSATNGFASITGGQLQSARDEFGGTSAYKDLVGDFNGDGVDDLFTVYAGTYGVWVYTALANGDGTFESVQGAGEGQFYGGGVSGHIASHRATFGSDDYYEERVADFNGDGFDDFGLFYSGGSGVWAYTAMGNGDGTFEVMKGANDGLENGKLTSARTDFGGNTSYDKRIGDFNGDGIADLSLMWSGESGAWAYTALGNGDGTFGTVIGGKLTSERDSFASTSTYKNDIGDFNGDGYDDVALFYSGSYGLWVYTAMGNGDGTFGTVLGGGTGTYDGDTTGKIVATGIDFGGTNEFETKIGDFNGDGYDDIAVIDASAEGLTAYLAMGTGTGSFGAATEYSLTSLLTTEVDTWTEDVGDFNGDGADDLVISSSGMAGVWSFVAQAATGGADIIVGGAGKDIMTGGFGRDRFVFNEVSESTDSNTDLITDFEEGRDLIDLGGLNIAFTDLTVTQANSVTHITANNSEFALDLTGTLNLEADDFEFV